jgi:hypothetical protein
MTATNVTTRQATAIGTDVISKLRSGIAESRANTVIAGGKPLLRLLKDANWVFGQRDDQVQEGSTWAVNPLSIAHGWVAWTNHEGNTKNTLVGEVMAPVHAPKPDRPQPIDGWAFTEQRLFELRCMDGDDEGTEVVYKISSVGGMRAVDDLLASLQGQLADNPLYPCPVVELLSDSYQHQKYGKIYVPIFDIVDWATMDGNLFSEDHPEQVTNGAQQAPQAQPEPAPKQPEPAAPPAPTPQPAPRRTRATRTAAAQPVAPTPPPAPAEPAPTARRRPIRR